LVNIPGEAASVVTCFDGYQMARKGRAGPALGIAAFASFIAGYFGIVMISVLAPSLSRIAFDFGPPEFFGLMVLGLTLSTFLGSGSMVKALLMVALGIVLGCVGTDPISGTPRLTYQIKALLDGLDMVPVVMGLFGISEVLFNLEKEGKREIYETRIKGLLPNREDWKKSINPIARGSVMGFFIGIIPGGTAVISSFVSYAIEKRISKRPEEFGKGAIEGVAGPEAANNAATFGSMVPLLTLGIPSNVVMALFLAALMIHGTTPGPLLIQNHPEFFWGIMFSMIVGNLMLLVLYLPLIGMWVKI
jgi:putative tricarboxylic transport membrane protein